MIFSKNSFSRLLLAGCLLVVSAVLAAAEEPDAAPADKLSPLAAAIEQAVTSGYEPEVLRRTDERRAIWSTVHDFYEQRRFAPRWNGDEAATESLLVSLKRSNEHGLVPSEYDASGLIQTYLDREGERRSVPVADQARLELALSAAFLALAHDLWDGRVEPRDVQDEHLVYLERESLEGVALLGMSETEDVYDLLQALAPQHDEYKQLQAALRALQKDSDRPEPPKLAFDHTLHPGDKGEEVLQVIERLRHAGYRIPEPSGKPAETEYTQTIADAVSAFQRASNLTEDGLLGENTRAQLNTSRAERMQTLAVNLDRWRWLPRDLGDSFLAVNIPEFRLELIRDGQVELDMKVIAGKAVHATPVFADKLEYIVLNPYWNIPNSIIENELLPQFREDPKAVLSKNMEILDLSNEPMEPVSMDWKGVTATDIRVRQKPGPQNSLGLAKFIFPNSHAIYLHDTPADQLFDASNRAFSHGCLRLEKPRELASAVLSDKPEWQASDIDRVMDGSNDETTIHLDGSLPVYITYFTAVADGDSVRYLHDVYGHDPVMVDALNDEASAPATTAVASGS